VSFAVMFHFFPIACVRCHADEQAFIFAPEFRVQVAKSQCANEPQRGPPRGCEIGGLQCRQTRLRPLRQNKKFRNHFKLICPVQP
jgi:hypothetical protein